MTLAIVLIVVAAVALIFILRFAYSQAMRVSPRAGLAPQIQPIDVEAFRNLIDPAEREYLRRRLCASEFRVVQRKRLQAMASYVHIASQNASVLASIGQAALHASDPQTVEAARQLTDNAVLLRRNATVALVRIYLAMVWPDANTAAAPILAGYMQLNVSAMLLGRLQNPVAPLRISGT